MNKGPQTFLAIGPNCWGRGDTMETAVKEAKKNWPRTFRMKGVVEMKTRIVAKHFNIYTCNDPKVWVDDWGDLRFDTTVSECPVRIQKSVCSST